MVKKRKIIEKLIYKKNRKKILYRKKTVISRFISDAPVAEKILFLQDFVIKFIFETTVKKL